MLADGTEQDGSERDKLELGGGSETVKQLECMAWLGIPGNAMRWYGMRGCAARFWLSVPLPEHVIA
jgi:hypothetical protein